MCVGETLAAGVLVIAAEYTSRRAAPNTHTGQTPPHRSALPASPVHTNHAASAHRRGIDGQARGDSDPPRRTGLIPGVARMAPPRSPGNPHPQPVFHTVMKATTSSTLMLPSPLKSAPGPDAFQFVMNATTSSTFTVPSPSKSAGQGPGTSVI